MSTLRKSFIIHKDSLSVLDELSNEQAGLLFKAIKAFQNDEDIELDGLTKIAFSPFKNQFARDNDKYVNLCEKNRLIAVKRHSTKSTSGTSGNDSLPSVTKSTDNDSKSKSKSKSDSNKDIKDLMSCKPDCVDIINHMNSVIGTKYKTSTKSHIQNISARLDEGHSVEDLKAVIDSKFKDWGNDPHMAQYLRPATLFQTSKFQGYLTASKTVGTGQHRDINEIGTDFSAPAEFKQIILGPNGECLGYE